MKKEKGDFVCLPLAWLNTDDTTSPKPLYGDVSGYEPVTLTEDLLAQMRAGKTPANPAAVVALVRALDEARGSQLTKLSPVLTKRIRDVLDREGKDFVAMRRHQNTIEVVYVTRPREIIQIMDLKECLAHFSKTMSSAEKDAFAAALFTTKIPRGK